MNLGPADLDRALAGRSRGRFWASRRHRQTAAIATSAVLAPFAGGSPVGSVFLDLGWSAVLAGLGAYLAVRCKRGPLIAAALVAVLSARTLPAITVGALSVVFATASTRHLRRKAVFSRGMVGGTVVISLLATSDHTTVPAFAVGVATVILLLGSSGYHNARTAERRIMRWGAMLLVVFCGLASGAAAFGVVDRGSLVDIGTIELRAGLAAARQGDAAGAAAHLEAARVALAGARHGVEQWGTAARFVPITAQHVGAVSAVLADVEQAASFAAQAAAIADDRLAVTAGTVDVEAVAELSGPLTRLVTAFEEVVREIDRRADDPLLPALSDRLERLRVESSRAHRDAAAGAEAARALPDVLGASGPRRYLVVFTSPAEARGRFGFPGSFAEVTFDDGRYRLGEHGSTSQLLTSTTYDQGDFDLGAQQLRPYLAYGSTRTVLSSTISPDFPTVAEVLGRMWAQSGRKPVDGVVRFDPSSIARLMTFTGPVSVSGRDDPLTADSIEQFLLVDQYVQYSASQTQAPRREVLDEVAETTFERLETADLPPPRELIDVFRTAVAGQHLQVALFDPDEQTFVRAVGLDGTFADPQVDGLVVTTVNGLGNKIDTFLDRTISYRGEVNANRVDATLEVTLGNEAPASGLPDYVIGSFSLPPPPKGTNRMTLLIYTAVPAESVDTDPSARLLQSGRSGGWWLHEIEVSLPSGGTTTVSLHLVGEVAGGPYQLVLEPGGGLAPDGVEVDLTVDGTPFRHQGLTLETMHLG